MPIRKRKVKKEEEIPLLDDQNRIIQEYKDKVKSPITAIRSHCVECLGGYVREISQCTVKGCSLYHFRMGTNTMDARSIKARGDDDE